VVRDNCFRDGIEFVGLGAYLSSIRDTQDGTCLLGEFLCGTNNQQMRAVVDGVVGSDNELACRFNERYVVADLTVVDRIEQHNRPIGIVGMADKVRRTERPMFM
jgi:hypothetical protein